MSDAAYKLNPGDACVVVLDPDRFRVLEQWWFDWASFSYPHCVTLNGRVVQFQLHGFVVQDAVAAELLREIQSG